MKKIAWLENIEHGDALSVEKLAEVIDFIPCPLNTDNEISLPKIDGFDVFISRSEREDIVDLSGRIFRPEKTTPVRLTLGIRNNETGEIAETAPLLVPIYKPYVKPTLSREEIEKAHRSYQRKAYGVFVHFISEYMSDWGALSSVYTDGTPVKTVDELSEAFDAKAFAKTMNELGAEYVVFTAWHGDTRTLFPSITNSRWRDDRRKKDSDGAKTYSERDVIADIIKELQTYEIEFHLYTHPCDGHDFNEEDQRLTGWNDEKGEYAVWNQYVNELYYELCERYADHVTGLWFDGQYNHVNNGEVQQRLRNTCCAFNPGMILTANLAFEEGKIYETSRFNGADYFSWEIPNGTNLETERKISRHQSDINMAKGGWFTRYPNTHKFPIIPTAEEMFRFLVAISSVSKEGGLLAATEFYPIRSGEMLDDYLSPGVGDEMRRLNREYISPVKESILNTNDSKAYPTKENISVCDLSWGVANESLDGKTIYFHVLNAPHTKKLILPEPKDKRKLSSDALIMHFNGEKTLVEIQKIEEGYAIILPEEAGWNRVDTIIKAQIFEA